MEKEMPKETVAAHRDRVLQNLNSIQERLKGNTALNEERHNNIKESLQDIKEQLVLMNGRVRDNENKISWIQGIGSILSVFFTAMIVWLFGSDR
jgi:hypothetical protein